jgi:hypothetical protein
LHHQTPDKTTLVTHRGEPVHCLWLEQFQIADSASVAGGAWRAVDRTQNVLFWLVFAW